MAPQNESNQESRDAEVKSDVGDVGTDNDRSTVLETRKVEPEPFSDDDPYRSTRIASIRSETDELLSEVQGLSVGLEGSSKRQLERIQQDVVERSGWSEARSDGFIGILRLGRKTPPRGARVL